jgi:hypothetical protein
MGDCKLTLNSLNLLNPSQETLVRGKLVERFYNDAEKQVKTSPVHPTKVEQAASRKATKILEQYNISDDFENRLKKFGGAPKEGDTTDPVLTASEESKKKFAKNDNDRRWYNFRCIQNYALNRVAMLSREAANLPRFKHNGSYPFQDSDGNQMLIPQAGSHTILRHAPLDELRPLLNPQMTKTKRKAAVNSRIKTGMFKETDKLNDWEDGLVGQRNGWAARSYKKGEAIDWYEGQVLTKAECESSLFIDNPKIDPKLRNKLWFGKSVSDPNNSDDDIIAIDGIGPSSTLNCKFKRDELDGRLMEDKDGCNVVIDGTPVKFVDGRKGVVGVLVAERDINEGEQLRVLYGWDKDNIEAQLGGPPCVTPN